jgi:hypothetical protein
MVVWETGDRTKLTPHGLPYPEVVHAGNAYEGHEHTGTHCAHAMSETDKQKASYKGLQGTCIMWGSGRDEAEPARQNFCDECMKYIKARNLSDVTTRFQAPRTAKDC